MNQLDLFETTEPTGAVATLPVHDQAIELDCPICGLPVTCLFLRRDQIGFFDPDHSRHGCKQWMRRT